MNDEVIMEMDKRGLLPVDPDWHERY